MKRPLFLCDLCDRNRAEVEGGMDKGHAGAVACGRDGLVMVIPKVAAKARRGVYVVFKGGAT